MVNAVGPLIHQTSTTTGTGNLTLAAVNGRNSFNAEFGTGGTDLFRYFVSSRDAAEWEYGTGHLFDATTLVRDTVIRSSNSDLAVSFSAGTLDVTCDRAPDSVLDDLEAAGTCSADSDILVGTAAGAMQWESGATARASLGLAIGSDVQAFDPDTLKADTADVLTAGFAATPYSAGTKSTGTFTPDEANGNFQYAVNGGAHTLAPPTNNCSIIVQYTNNASAGTITTTGFTKVDGDSLTTTNGDDFFFFIVKCNGFSSLTVKALQ